MTAASPLSASSPAVQGQTRIGVIGLGIMGGLYAAHLLAAGFEACGFDIAEDRIESFRRAGGHVGGSPSQVVAEADVIIVALSSVDAFRNEFIEPGGAGSCARPGQIFVETGTIPIPLKEQAREALGKHGAAMLDAPVTGTRVHAERRDIVVYASGDEADFMAVRPVLDAFAKDVRHVGAFGAGMKLKIVTNLLVAVHNVAAAEALALAKAAGLELRLVHDLITSGAASSAAFGFRGLMMVEDRFDPATMRMDVFSKDLAIIGEFARSVRASIPLMEASTQLYRTALDRGTQAKDIAAVFEVLSSASDETHPSLRPEALQ